MVVLGFFSLGSSYDITYNTLNEEKQQPSKFTVNAMERLHSVSSPTVCLDHLYSFTAITYFLLLNSNFEFLKTMLHLTIKQMRCGAYLWRPQSLNIKSDIIINANIKFKHEKIII